MIGMKNNRMSNAVIVSVEFTDTGKKPNTLSGGESAAASMCTHQLSSQQCQRLDRAVGPSRPIDQVGKDGAEGFLLAQREHVKARHSRGNEYRLFQRLAHVGHFGVQRPDLTLQRGIDGFEGP